jgi:hypothetical protein
MTVKLDESPASGILITCSECPYWYAFRFDKLEAYTASEGHQVNVHDMPAKPAGEARRKYLKRIARAAKAKQRT